MRRVFVKPLIEGSTAILWHAVDQGMIDATVNNSADAARHVSDEVRHMQSGNLRSYAGWVAAGGAAVIAYMVWMGISMNTARLQSDHSLAGYFYSRGGRPADPAYPAPRSRYQLFALVISLLAFVASLHLPVTCTAPRRFPV